MDQAAIANELCATCRLFGARQWCLATSGNFSVRVEGQRFLITKSGREKSALAADDLMLCKLDGSAIEQSNKPSAETPLHARLYSLDESIGAVLHTHSVPATILSMNAESSIDITGFEMQKALIGYESHNDTVSVPVFANDQDMNALSDCVDQAWINGAIETPGLLIRGHGLYAWGGDIAEARRHVEGFEFLFECLLRGSQRQ